MGVCVHACYVYTNDMCASWPARPLGLTSRLPAVPHPAVNMADGPSGPAQMGQGSNGQYVYWVVMSNPTPEAVERLSLKKPSDLTKAEFCALMVEAHAVEGTDLVEVAVFCEPHANGEPHLNALVRAARPFRWKNPADYLYTENHE